MMLEPEHARAPTADHDPPCPAERARLAQKIFCYEDVKIEPFALERWMTRHEMHVTYDIAESGICPLRMADLLAWEDEARGDTLESLLDLPLGYSEARGSEALRSAIAATYQHCDPDNVL